MKKIKIVTALIGILMIAALVSAYKQGSKTVDYKEMAHPLSAINYLIEEGSKVNNKAAYEVMTEKYRYMEFDNETIWYLNLQGVTISDITENKDEKPIELYKNSNAFKTKDVDEVKIFTATENYANAPNNQKHTRFFVVVRLKDSVGWLIDDVGFNQELVNYFNSK